MRPNSDSRPPFVSRCPRSCPPAVFRRIPSRSNCMPAMDVRQIRPRARSPQARHAELVSGGTEGGNSVSAISQQRRSPPLAGREAFADIARLKDACLEQCERLALALRPRRLAAVWLPSASFAYSGGHRCHLRLAQSAAGAVNAVVPSLLHSARCRSRGCAARRGGRTLSGRAMLQEACLSAPTVQGCKETDLMLMSHGVLAPIRDAPTTTGAPHAALRRCAACLASVSPDKSVLYFCCDSLMRGLWPASQGCQLASAALVESLRKGR